MLREKRLDKNQKIVSKKSYEIQIFGSSYGFFGKKGSVGGIEGWRNGGVIGCWEWED